MINLTSTIHTYRVNHKSKIKFFRLKLNRKFKMWNGTGKKGPYKFIP